VRILTLTILMLGYLVRFNYVAIREGKLGLVAKRSQIRLGKVTVTALSDYEE